MRSRTGLYAYWGLALLLCLAEGIRAQSGNNPFDLIPRLIAGGDGSDPDDAPVAADTANPFDIAPYPGPAMENPSPPLASLRIEAGAPERFSQLKLGVVLVLLILLAFLVTLLRSLVHRTFGAFFNDTLMNQLYREQEGRGVLPFLLLYAMFLFNAGVFVFLLLHYWGYGDDISPDPLRNLLYCVAGVSVLFSLKHLVLLFLGYVFPIEKEVSRYNFTIILYGIAIGFFLAPVNIFLAYGAEGIVRFVVLLALTMLALTYLFRYFRSLIIFNKLVLFHKFHFLLYICTVEIAPVFFLLKIVSAKL